MRTRISVPDEIVDRVSERATAMGMTRSAFFARAAQRYLDALDAESLTVQIDTVLEILGGPDESQDAAVAAGRCLALSPSPKTSLPVVTLGTEIATEEVHAVDDE